MKMKEKKREKHREWGGVFVRPTLETEWN